MIQWRDSGRFAMGQRVPLLVFTRDERGLPAWPEAVPVARVYAPSGLVATVPLPVVGRFATVGVFCHDLPLGESYSPGHHAVLYSYTVAGRPVIAEDHFEVAGGGDAAGAVISMFSTRLPEATYVLAHVDSGRILLGRNPGF